MPRPLCYVLIPFGTRSAASRAIDFDAVYRDLIAPAIEDAGLQPLRAAEESTNGTLHTAQIEQLMLCDCAIVDLTTASASTFYALGARRALRPASTLVIYASHAGPLPFDVAPWQAMPYELSTPGALSDVAANRRALADLLQQARAAPNYNALYELVDGATAGDIERLKTDVFRDKVEYSPSIKKALEQARTQGVDALRAEQRKLDDLKAAPAAVVIDLFLSYRAVKAWDDMIALVDEMAPPLAASVMVQEQLAFALNRAGRGEEAQRILTGLLARRGDSSETCALLGRVYKDRWESALEKGDRSAAKDLLQKAIEAYLHGFEADWRDAFPGVNAVTLMELREPPDARQQRLIPVVRYAVERRIATGQPDYWDYATLLELAVLGRDEAGAHKALRDALSHVRESWEPESTARNLRLIHEARAQRGETLPWAQQAEQALLQKALAPQ